MSQKNTLLTALIDVPTLPESALSKKSSTALLIAEVKNGETLTALSRFNATDKHLRKTYDHGNDDCNSGPCRGDFSIERHPCEPIGKKSLFGNV